MSPDRPAGRDHRATLDAVMEIGRCAPRTDGQRPDPLLAAKDQRRADDLLREAIIEGAIRIVQETARAALAVLILGRLLRRRPAF